jgi:L-asparaginase / beta-aspartyl-peptidase
VISKLNSGLVGGDGNSHGVWRLAFRLRQYLDIVRNIRAGFRLRQPIVSGFTTSKGFVGQVGVFRFRRCRCFPLVRYLAFPIALVAQMAVGPMNSWATEKGVKFRLVIHGGAGALKKEMMTPEKEAEYRQALSESLQAGYEILSKGGSALDAVMASVKVMEDSPLFNAGKGAVFNHDGINELDAAIMDGRTLAAGAVGGVTTLKNPIIGAYLVMTKSNHVMLVGKGADQFAAANGAETVSPDYYFTEQRWKELQEAKEKEAKETEKKPGDHSELQLDEKYGTVGVVGLDESGSLAAGTSTGGLTNKRFGRIGDSPIIGAGTYADNESCAISATGTGEMFIRAVAAHEVAGLVKYKGLSVSQAAQTVLDKIKTLGGTGGLIVLDRNGNYTMQFNTSGMYRGTIGPDGKPETAIYQ